MGYTPVAQRNKPSARTTGYIPVTQRAATSSVTATRPPQLLSLTTDDDFKVGVFDVLKEMPRETINLFKNIGQSTVRGYAATGQRIVQSVDDLTRGKNPPVTGEVVDPRTFFGSSSLAQKVGVAVFGKDKPFSAKTEDVELLESFGVDPKIGVRTGGSLTVLLSALDVFGGGEGARGLVGLTRALKVAKVADDAADILRRARVSEDLIEQYAPVFAKAKTTKEVTTALEALAKLQETTKAVKPGTYTPVIARTGAEAVPSMADEIAPELRPLAEEARKGEYLYHGTNKTTFEAIQEKGIVPQRRGVSSFSTDEAYSRNWADNPWTKTEGVMFRVKKEVLDGKLVKPTGRRPATDEQFEVLTKETVAPENIEVLKDGKWQPLVKENPLFAEARKYKSAEEFVEAIENTGIENRQIKNIPIRDIDFDFEIAKRDLPKAQEEITRGIARPISDEPIRAYFNISTGKYDVVDGYHRLANALKKGEKEIKAGIEYKSNVSGNQTKSQLTDIWKKAQEQGGGIPGKTGLAKFNLSPESPRRLTKTEPTLLKERIKQQATGARAGFREGRKVGQSEAENIARTQQEKIVRSEQLKSLRKGIELRTKKDKIIEVLKNTSQSEDRIQQMIVEHVKDALDVSDRGKAITLVKNAKTHKDLVKAFARVNRWAEDAIKRTLKNDILKAQKSIMDSPSIAIDYKARVKELMGDFELKGHREDTLTRLKKTQEFLQSEAAKGNDVELPRRILRSLELLNRTPFDEITINQLKGLQAELELLEDLGRTKFRTIENIWEIQKAKILDEVAAQGAEPLSNRELIRPGIGERLTATQKLKNLLYRATNEAARIDKAISPMDTIFDLLDGGKGAYDGANFRFFKSQVDAGYGRYISRKSSLQEPVIELAQKYKLNDTNFERMGVVAAREQDGGMEKLIASGFTEDEVNAIKLSKQEQEVLDSMRQTFDSQFPEIKDTMRRIYNQSVEKVKNYFSFMTDWKAMDESEVFSRFGSQAPEQYGAPKKNVEAGFTKSRVGGGQKIKVNAMDVFMQHTDNTSYLLEVGETAKMLGEVAADPKYAELVGDVGQLLVREWVDVIARKGGAAGAQQIAILDTLRRNVGAGILGLKLSTVAIQPTSIIDGMGFIGMEYGTKGVRNFLTDKDWRIFVAKMPEISDRLGGEFALRELSDDNWLQTIQRKGFIPLQKLDQVSAGMIAAGAYERKMVELGEMIDFTKPFNKEALEYAQLAVRRTQSSGSFKDVPLAVSRGALTGNRSLDRAMLQFQNFLLTRWSRIRHDAIRAGINTRDPKKAIPVFTVIIFSALAASGIRLGVNKIQDFLTGREDEDSVTQDLAKSFVFEMTGNVPFLGTAVSMAMYDGEMFPILDAPKGVISGLNRVITSESTGAKLRGFTEFAGSTGALLGIPGSAQSEQLLRGALQEEKKSGGSTSKKLKTPPGLPELPSLKSTLPSLPKLPTL